MYVKHAKELALSSPKSKNMIILKITIAFYDKSYFLCII